MIIIATANIYVNCLTDKMQQRYLPEPVPDVLMFLYYDLTKNIQATTAVITANRVDYFYRHSQRNITRGTFFRRSCWVRARAAWQRVHCIRTCGGQQFHSQQAMLSSRICSCVIRSYLSFPGRRMPAGIDRCNCHWPDLTPHHKFPAYRDTLCHFGNRSLARTLLEQYADGWFPFLASTQQIHWCCNIPSQH